MMDRRLLIVGVCVASMAAGWALAWLDEADAQTRISQMPSATTLTGAELLPVVQNGANAVTTPAAIGTYVQSALGAWPTISPTPTAGDCVKWISAGQLGDAGAACASGSFTPGGTSGQIQYNNAGAFGGLATTGSGSVVLSTSPSLVTPALGTPSALVLTNATGLPNAAVIGLAASATTDATNAANIASGTLGAGRLSGSYTGITGVGTLSAGSIPSSLVTGLGTFAAQSYASPPAIGGTTPAAGTFSSLTDTAMTGGPYCVTQTSGVLSSTGSACGSSSASGANPTGSVGLTTTNGVATTFMRSDASPPLGAQGANTFVANETGASATPTYASLPSCSGSNSALQYTSGTGLSCLTTVALTGANTFTGAQTVPTSDLRLVGASTGYTTLNSGLASTSNNTLTLPTTSSDTLAGLGTAQTFSAADAFSLAPGASASAVTLSGAPYTGGTATTNFPLLYFNTSGASAVTGFSTAGGYLGINAPSGFSGHFFDFFINGGSTDLAYVTAAGSWVGAANVSMGASGFLAFGTRGNLTSPAANSLQVGAADAVSPSVQTLRGQGVVGGTLNAAGVNLNLLAGPGTGTGAGGSLVFQTAPAASGSGTTQNAGQTVLTLDQKAHAGFASAAIPTVSSCGTGSPAVTAGSTDVAGAVTVGTSATACTISFKQSYASAPFCVLSDITVRADLTSYTISTSALTLTMTSNSGDVVDYICHGI